MIYTSFKESFSDLNIRLLNPDDLKSAEAKEVGVCVCKITVGTEIRIMSGMCAVLGLFDLCPFPPQRWRPFCNQFDGVVEDFNYGTLLRLDCERDYTEENTIFGDDDTRNTTHSFISLCDYHWGKKERK